MDVLERTALRIPGLLRVTQPRLGPRVRVRRRTVRPLIILTPRFGTGLWAGQVASPPRTLAGVNLTSKGNGAFNQERRPRELRQCSRSHALHGANLRFWALAAREGGLLCSSLWKNPQEMGQSADHSVTRRYTKKSDDDNRMKPFPLRALHRLRFCQVLSRSSAGPGDKQQYGPVGTTS